MGIGLGEAHERSDSKSEPLIIVERFVSPDTKESTLIEGFDHGVITHTSGASFAKISVANVDSRMMPAGIGGSIVQFELRFDDPPFYQARA